MKRRILVFGLFLLSCSSLYSQQALTPDLYRRINYNVIRLIENYESYCTFYGFNSDVSFYSLFTDNARIYNDYLPLNTKQELSPEEYYNLTQEESTKSTIGVEISNLRFVDSLEVIGSNNYRVKLKLNKKIYFRNWNNFRYPDRVLSLKFDIIVNTQSSKDIDCKIRAITCETPIKEFSITEFNFKNVDVTKGYINVLDETLGFTEIEKQPLFIPNVPNPKDVVTIDSYDTYLRVKSDTATIPDKNIYFIDVRNYLFDIGVNVQYNITSNYQLNTVEESYNSLLKNINTKSYGYGIGLDFNSRIAKSRRVNYYLNFGVGFEKNGIEFYGSNYNEYATKDIDNDAYLRQIQLNDIKEEIDLSYFYLPLGLKIKYFLDKEFSIEATVGAKLYYLIDKKYSVTTNASYKGYYEQFDKLTMDHYYDYGYYDLSFQNQKLDLPEFNYGLFGNIGASYRINERYSTSMRMAYDYSMVNISNYNGTYVLSETKDDYKSLIYSYDKISKSNLNIKLGINYHF